MKELKDITKEDKTEIENELNVYANTDDMHINLFIDEEGIAFSIEHDDGFYTMVDFKYFYKTIELLKQYGYKTK